MRLNDFNLSLLGKWVWRVLDEWGSMWYKVLCAKYDEEGGMLCFGREEGSIWWKKADDQFKGGRVNFELSDDKLITVTDMYALGCDVNGEVWKWRRRLFAREEELVRECVDLLLFCRLRWQTDEFGKFIHFDLGSNHVLWLKAVPLKVNIFIWRLHFKSNSFGGY